MARGLMLFFLKKKEVFQGTFLVLSIISSHCVLSENENLHNNARNNNFDTRRQVSCISFFEPFLYGHTWNKTFYQMFPEADKEFETMLRETFWSICEECAKYNPHDPDDHSKSNGPLDLVDSRNKLYEIVNNSLEKKILVSDFLIFIQLLTKNHQVLRVLSKS
jgi:hypothetical protein